MTFVLLIILGFAWYVMNEEERRRVLRGVRAILRLVIHAATDRPAACEPFREALHARTRLPVVTPIIVLLNVIILLRMFLGGAPIGAPDTLISWGANFGPRTTNGEWWRLVTMMFVHSGLLHLIVSLAAVLQAGVLLERLVGPLAFGTVYVAAGTAASLVSLSANPLGISVGPSGAIFGIYGLLVAACMYGVLNRSALTIPLLVLKRFAPTAAVFLLYSLVTGAVATAAEFAGFVTGFVFGVVLARGVAEAKPPARRVGFAFAATMVIAVVSAVPLRGLSDVRPELQRVVALEEETSSRYAAAVERFKLGRLTAEQLAEVIDRKVLPELVVVRDRLKGLVGVPAEHQTLVTDAEEYLRLRVESWRVRSEALHSANMRRLRDADRVERASLSTFEKIKATGI